MLRVVETVMDGLTGRMKTREPLVLIFRDRDEAATFVQSHVERAFANGRYGYDEEGDYWWGCDEKAELQICRYTIE